MKINKKITSLGLALTMALGVGVAVSAVNGQMLESKASSSLATTADFTAKTTRSTTYTSEWTYGDNWKIKGAANNNAEWGYLRVGGKSTAATKIGTISNVNAIAADINQIKIDLLNYESGTGYTLDSIDLNVYSDSELTTSVDAVNIAKAAFPTTMEGSYYVVTFAPTASLTSWGANHFYKFSFNWSSTSSKNRGADLAKIEFYNENNVLPTSITVTGDKSTLTKVGEVVKGTVSAILPEGAINTVTWSSSDETVLAKLDEEGSFHALKAGNANIIATSTVASTVSGSYAVSVTAASASVYDKTFTASKLEIPATYADGIYSADGIAFDAKNVMKKSASLDQFQFRGSPNGELVNIIAFPSAIKDIIVTLNSANTATTFELKAGTTKDVTAMTVVTPTISADTFVYTYDLSAITGAKYFYIHRSATTGTVYMDSIIVEMVDTNVEAGRGYATSFLSTTAAECAAKAVTAETWGNLKTSFEALSADAKAALTGELHSVLSVTDIQKALQRYLLIVSLYGYENFMGLTLSGANNTISNPINANNGMIAIVAIVSIISVATCVLVVLSVKKRKHN